MREKLKKMRNDVWHGPCYTYADYMICENICANIPDAEIPEIVMFAGLSNGRRTTEKQASLYDAMMAEILDERNKAKARRVRKPDNRTRAERLADWAEEKRDRKDRRAQYACNHINKKYGYVPFADERRISAEKIARADYELEQDQEHAERLDAEDLRDRIAEAKKNRDSAINAAENMIASIRAEIAELRKEQDPADWNSVWSYMNKTELFKYDHFRY